jgi:hypothetical protein
LAGKGRYVPGDVLDALFVSKDRARQSANLVDEVQPGAHYREGAFSVDPGRIHRGPAFKLAVGLVAAIFGASLGLLGRPHPDLKRRSLVAHLVRRRLHLAGGLDDHGQ